jgi:hypothetical protein
LNPITHECDTVKLRRLCRGNSDEKNIALAYLRAYYGQDYLKLLCSDIPIAEGYLRPRFSKEIGGKSRGVEIIVSFPIKRP